MTDNEYERYLRQEVVKCPECCHFVVTVPAEDVPAQQLRGCLCGAVFFLDLDNPPRYAGVNDLGK